MERLPNDIARRILSLVDPSSKEAVKLQLVSKEFCKLVQNRPALVLDREEFDSEAKYAGEVNFVLTTLESYEEDLESFTFRPLCPLFGPVVDDDVHNRCIDLAIEKGVRKLDLNMMDSNVLPQSVFRIENLAELHLTDCCLKPAKSGLISWPKLTKLHLDSVDMSDGVFDSMMRGSPLIEVLEIKDCYQRDCFRVSDLCCLKKLEVSLNCSQSLQLHNVARNLESIVCNFGQIDFGNSEYPRLEILDLKHVTTDEKFLSNVVHKFPRLEELYMEHLKLARIKICSHSLKRLELVEMEELQEACFELPNIDVFCFENSSIPRLSFSGNSRGWTSSIKLVDSSVVSESWFVELNHFLAAMKGSQTWMDVLLGGEVEDDNAEITNDAVSFSGMIREPHKKTTGTTFTVTSARLMEDGVVWNGTPETLVFQNWSDFLNLLLNEMAWIQSDEMAESEAEFEDEHLSEEPEDEDPCEFHGEPENEDPGHFHEELDAEDHFPTMCYED